VTGVLGLVNRTDPGGYSAGVRGVNKGTGVTGIGTIGYQAGSGYGVYGETPNGWGVYGYATNGTSDNNGVRGETQSQNGAGVAAVSSSGNLSTALRIVNGRIAVSGTERPAFRVTVATRCGPGDAFAEINSSFTNGVPGALLFATVTGSSSDAPSTFQAVGTEYNDSANALGSGCTTGRWHIRTIDGSALAVGTKVNVLVITPGA
jgi:hypothetical protein